MPSWVWICPSARWTPRDKDLLIIAPSFIRSPSAPVCFTSESSIQKTPRVTYCIFKMSNFRRSFDMFDPCKAKHKARSSLAWEPSTCRRTFSLPARSTKLIIETRVEPQATADLPLRSDFCRLIFGDSLQTILFPGHFFHFNTDLSVSQRCLRNKVEQTISAHDMMSQSWTQ